MNRLSRVLVLVLASVTWMAAAEGKLMHCFYFTAVESASEADWQAFFKATDELPKKIPGLYRVWYGKLLRPLQVLTTDKEVMQKLRSGEKEVTGPVRALSRQWGVCMEMQDENALKAYADHPAHREWEQVYFKVRQPGTTTVDIVALK